MSKEILEPHIWSLETLFKNIYRVPVYQRPYSWDKEQIDVLLNDIFNNYYLNKKEEYYIGNIIIYDKNEKVKGQISKYDIIDGQQRITSFVLILLATYCICHKLKIEETNDSLKNIKKVLWKDIERKYHKKLRAIELNSIEKECFQNIYNICFEYPEEALELVKKEDIKSEFDKRIVKNFENIYNTILNNIKGKETYEILNFSEYLLQSIKVIVIETYCEEKEVFSIFESINSKGKRLETIDLIKTYIFSKIDKEDYEEYLKIWGDLIIKTKDNLYDYIYNYIKAYLSFYRQNITVLNFKNISNEEMLKYYKKDNEQETLKALLKDLQKKVKFYNMLFSTQEATNLIKSNKFRFYYQTFIMLGFQHPRALFFRIFNEYSENKLSKEEAVDIFIETILYMIKFITISDRDSKDVVTTFSKILNKIYEDNYIDKDIIFNYMESNLELKNVKDENIKNSLKNIDCYEHKKNLAVIIIALYDSFDKKNNSISYDKAFEIIKNYGEIYSLDHLLVQNPKEDDEKYKYYCSKKDDVLILKEGNDFPENIVNSGMDYEMFRQKILNKIGNLRICYKDENSRRQHNEIDICEYSNFFEYKKIKERENDIANTVIDKCFPKVQINETKIKEIMKRKKRRKFIGMDEIIKIGILKPGDEIYITYDPKNSIAILKDSKYVYYKGEKMTLNKWGCLITGWKAIRIYDHMAKVGEQETIQEKRMRIDNV